MTASIRSSSGPQKLLGLALLFPMVAVLTGCRHEDLGCQPYENQCHAGTTWVGEPYCDCMFPSDVPIEGLEGSRSTGTVSLAGIAGWKVEQVVTAQPRSVAASGSRSDGSRATSNGYPVRVTGASPASLAFSTDVIGGVPFGVLGLTDPAVVVNWNGPVRLRLRSPSGVLSVVEFDAPSSTLPVRVTRLGPTLIRIDGDVVQGVVRLALVGFVGTDGPAD